MIQTGRIMRDMPFCKVRTAADAPAMMAVSWSPGDGDAGIAAMVMTCAGRARLRIPIGPLSEPSPRRKARSSRRAMVWTRSSRTTSSTPIGARRIRSFETGTIAVSLRATKFTSSKRSCETVISSKLVLIGGGRAAREARDRQVAHRHPDFHRVRAAHGGHGAEQLDQVGHEILRDQRAAFAGNARIQRAGDDDRRRSGS